MFFPDLLIFAAMDQPIDLAMIRAKRVEIEKGIAEAQAFIDAQRSLLADIDASERVLMMLFGDERAPIRPFPLFASLTHKLSGVGYASRPLENGNPFKAGTIKALIWETLNSSEAIWLDANQIREAVSELKGEDVAIATISPTLSYMKGDYIERRGLHVALKSRLYENGEAEASPEADEGATSSNA